MKPKTIKQAAIQSRAILTPRQRQEFTRLCDAVVIGDYDYALRGNPQKRRQRTRALGKLALWVSNLHRASMSKG